MQEDSKKTRFQPLKTDHLEIREFEKSDITDKYVGWLNDPDVVRYSELRHRRQTEEMCFEFFEASLRSVDIFLAITETSEGLGHIGNMIAYVDSANNVANLSILIGEKTAWGKGYGKEAWCAVVEALLYREGFRKVEAGTMEVNRAMLGLMAAAGMKHDGTSKAQFALNGSEVDLVRSAIFK